MRLNSTTTLLVFFLFAMASALIAVNQYIVSEITSSAEFPTPTSPQWVEHRKRAGELEQKMMECKDPIELEKLRRQHAALTEQWKKRIKQIR